MPSKFYKHKLLLDEHMYARQSYPRLNRRFDVKHIREDVRRGGASDLTVYGSAHSQGRIVVTANGRHFRGLVDAASPGVIDVPADWSPAQVDTKLTAILMRHGASYFAGQFRTLATKQPA